MKKFGNIAWSKLVEYGDSFAMQLPKLIYNNPKFPFNWKERFVIQYEGDRIIFRKPTEEEARMVRLAETGITQESQE